MLVLSFNTRNVYVWVNYLPSEKNSIPIPSLLQKQFIGSWKTSQLNIDDFIQIYDEKRQDYKKKLGVGVKGAVRGRCHADLVGKFPDVQLEIRHKAKKGPPGTFHTMELDIDVQSCVKDFEDLSQEFKTLTALHKQYVQKLDEVASLQAKCEKEINHERYRLGVIKKTLKRYSKKPECKDVVEELEQNMMRRKADLVEIEQALPKKNGLYLKIILGNVNVSILNKDEKFRYKDEYEKFKLIINGIGLLISICNIFMNSRVLDLIFMFLLVWYYCTLTIRESILKVNGSKIKGWWRMHHFISTALSGVLLIWPNNSVYYSFRSQFMWFNVYISLVQFLQFRYQRGVLYRLRALGERHNMDITIEGFHSWMWRGLSFLLPFLFIGYFFQAYNAYVLYHLSFEKEATWQVPVLSALFLFVFLGNIITTVMVIPQKLKEKVKLRDRISSIHKFIHGHNGPELDPGTGVPATPAEGEPNIATNPAEEETKKTS